MQCGVWDVDLTAGNRAKVRLTLTNSRGEESWIEFDDLEQARDLAQSLLYQVGSASYLRMQDSGLILKEAIDA